VISPRLVEHDGSFVFLQRGSESDRYRQSLTLLPNRSDRLIIDVGDDFDDGDDDALDRCCEKSLKVDALLIERARLFVGGLAVDLDVSSVGFETFDGDCINALRFVVDCTAAGRSGTCERALKQYSRQRHHPRPRCASSPSTETSASRCQHYSAVSKSRRCLSASSA
jgi:hypothetical protein